MENRTTTDHISSLLYKLSPGVRRGRHTQDRVDLTRLDFIEKMAIESHKDLKLENSSLQQAGQHKQTSEWTITEGCTTNRQGWKPGPAF